MKRALLVLSGLVLWGAAAIYFLGCTPVTPTPPNPPALMTPIPNCPALPKLPTSADVCRGLSTPEGFQCVRCAVEAGCRFVRAEIYCTTSCSDKKCGRR